jgi:hypothetical protein
MAAACGLLVALTAAPFAAAQESGGEMKPLAVVAFSGYDELMQDIDFLGGLGGQDGASQNLEQMLMMFTQQQGLAGLDKSKPIGAVLQSDGQMPGGAVCLPVTDLNALLQVLAPFGITSEDAGDGLLQIKAQGQGVFAKQADGWVMLSLSPDMLAAVPADPSALLTPLTEQYDLAVEVNVQNLPAAYKEMAISAMSEGAKQGLVKQSDESDEDFSKREAQVEAQLNELKRFFNEVDRFTFGLAVDGEEKRAYLDIAYTAIDGTKLAEELAAGADAKTNFAGFVQEDAAATLSFASKVTGADAAQLDQMIATLRAQAGKAIEDEAELKNDASKESLKAAFNDFIDALDATLKAGVVDGGATLKMDPEAVTFVAGGYIADPSKVESGLKKIAEVAEQEGEEVPEIKWAAENQGGVTFHTMSIPVPEGEEEARKVFGDNLELAVGIGKDAVFFGAGRDCIAAVNDVIAKSAASPQKPTLPMALTVSLGQIMNTAKELAPASEKPQIEMVAEMLNNEAGGRDHVKLAAEPIENGIRVRFEAEEGVLRAVGMAAMQAQMQAAGAGF